MVKFVSVQQIWDLQEFGDDGDCRIILPTSPHCLPPDTRNDQVKSAAIINQINFWSWLLLASSVWLCYATLLAIQGDISAVISMTRMVWHLWQPGNLLWSADPSDWSSSPPPHGRLSQSLADSPAVKSSVMRSQLWYPQDTGLTGPPTPGSPWRKNRNT